MQALLYLVWVSFLAKAIMLSCLNLCFWTRYKRQSMALLFYLFYDPQVFVVEADVEVGDQVLQVDFRLAEKVSDLAELLDQLADDYLFFVLEFFEEWEQLRSGFLRAQLAGHLVEPGDAFQPFGEFFVFQVFHLVQEGCQGVGLGFGHYKIGIEKREREGDLN